MAISIEYKEKHSEHAKEITKKISCRKSIIN